MLLHELVQHDRLLSNRQNRVEARDLLVLVRLDVCSVSLMNVGIDFEKLFLVGLADQGCCALGQNP